ncbi:hypothetical protein HanXRQr2_Chr15g0714451 [Helianthus annuus]|uniref:Uncharacterized protein n=1 Tax=Helianthus annuus TaxID=4232 RepID=A0A9K3H6A1_HELAN|nr:hypothetical protein HanXRQr2_Chr15g0714451 [Helianthus annuus]KAJ0833037.1 hypothetical protein HanPSC8_Chr15g0685631 [Helianthus annuus]
MAGGSGGVALDDGDTDGGGTVVVMVCDEVVCVGGVCVDEMAAVWLLATVFVIAGQPIVADVQAVVGEYSIAHLQQMLVEQVLEQEEQKIGLFELLTAAAPYLLFLQLKIPGFQLWPSIHYILNHHLN